MFKPPGRVLPLCWVIWMCRRFDPLFWHSEDWTRSFWGIFSPPPTPKRSFGVLKLPILTEFDLLGPKFNFSLDLFGSNFQWPAAHPHQFSDRVPPPGLNLEPVLPWETYLDPALATAYHWRCQEFALQQFVCKQRGMQLALPYNEPDYRTCNPTSRDGTDYTNTWLRPTVEAPTSWQWWSVCAMRSLS